MQEVKTQHFLYLMENASLQAVIEITTINKSNFLVLERAGGFPAKANRNSIIKRIYKISISAATDVSDPNNGANGQSFNGKTVE